MMPTKEWLAELARVKEKTASPVDLNLYFEAETLAGKHLAVMPIGPCDLPSGKVLVCDPLVELGLGRQRPYFQRAPQGRYETEVCVIQPDEEGDCARYAAVRLCFSAERPVRFYEALVGNETLQALDDEDDLFFGFPVDAGLACICDYEVEAAFDDWSTQWQEAHPDGNLYDDYFAAHFAESHRQHPTFQREGGDWLNWQVPGTEYHIPMFQSGFGDGVYPVYWGVDAAGAICQLVVQFIDIELTYLDDDEGDF